MQTLYIHIGLPKTGTSSIQSWLSINSATTLDQAGINYADLTPQAKLGKITSGNARLLIETLRKSESFAETKNELDKYFIKTYFGEKSRGLISSETLAGLPKKSLRNLSEFLLENSIKVQVIVYIRNIFDHAWSAYQQQIKRADYGHSFEEFAKNYNNPQVIYIRKWLEYFPNLSVTHYDSVKKELIGSFCNHIGIRDSDTSLTDVNISVNRSLTQIEIELLKRINSEATQRNLSFKGELSDSLIYNNPNATPLKYVDAVIADEFSKRFADDLAWTRKTFQSCSNLCITSANLEPPLKGIPKTDEIHEEIYVIINTLLDKIQKLQASQHKTNPILQ